MRSLCLVVLVWPLCASAAPDSASARILGQWRRAYSTSSLQFFADGSCLLAREASWKQPSGRCHWALAGDVLTFTNFEGRCASPPAERVGRYRVVIGADTMHFTMVGKDACLPRSTIDGNTWVRIDPKRPWNAPLPEMDPFALLVGHWSCQWRTKGDPTVTRSQLTVEPAWDGTWQTVRDEAVEGGRVVDGLVGQWGFDPWARSVVAFFTTREGGWRRATSPGWRGDRIVFTGEGNGHDHFELRQTIVRKSERQLELTTEITGGKPYDVGTVTTESCSRQ